jgi:hypothetical protein
MATKPTAVFLDFATLGPNVDTRALEALVAARYHDLSGPLEVAARVAGCEIADALVRRGAWTASRTFALFDYPMRELTNRTLGIVGSGTIGQAVARLGAAFGMRAVFAARVGTPRNEVPAGRVHFDDLLRYLGGGQLRRLV